MRFTQLETVFMAEVEERIYVGQEENNAEIEALKRRVLSVFEEYSKLNNRISPETVLSVMSIEDPEQLADIITSNLMLKVEQKQEILNEFQPKLRLEKLLETLIKEIDIMQIERDINIKVRKQIDKTQKEYYLREQLKAIQNELGDKEGITGEVEEYKRKLREGNFGEEVEKKVLKELDRLLKMPSGSAEGAVIRTYLDWIFDLPWDKKQRKL